MESMTSLRNVIPNTYVVKVYSRFRARWEILVMCSMTGLKRIRCKSLIIQKTMNTKMWDMSKKKV